MAKSYFKWKRYALIQDGFKSVAQPPSTELGTSVSGYDGFNFDKTTGIYSNSGPFKTLYATGDTRHSGSGTSASIRTLVALEGQTSPTYVRSTGYLSLPNMVKGPLIDEVVSRSRNTYPDNGEKDGYHYEYVGDSYGGVLVPLYDYASLPKVDTPDVTLDITFSDDVILHQLSQNICYSYSTYTSGEYAPILGKVGVYNGNALIKEWDVACKYKPSTVPAIGSDTRYFEWQDINIDEPIRLTKNTRYTIKIKKDVSTFNRNGHAVFFANTHNATSRTIQFTNSEGIKSTVSVNAGANKIPVISLDVSKIPNTSPALTLSISNNQTLYENSILQVTGTAHDPDPDQSVTAYYQINNDAKKVLATNVSKMQIPLNKQLTFKSGKLFDGVTAVSGSLVDGVAHTLKVWAVDSEGAESVIETRTFYVVPNRAPRLEVTPPTVEGNIDSDTFTVSGTYADDDKNEVIISYRINGNVSKEVARGTDGTFDFTLSLAQLKNGNNTISVEAIDSYGAKTSRTIKMHKNTIATPLLQSTVRYLIQPPKGSAQAVLLWLQRDQELAVTASLHMGIKGEAEAFTLLEPTNTAPLRDNAAILEDEFYHEADSAKDHIILQLDMLRSSVESTAAIHLISGVFE